MTEPDSERTGWSVRANRTQGSRAVGGRLFVANGRLVFSPHTLERRLGGEAWFVSLDAIRGVAVEPRSWNLLSGALRRRLRIDVDGGQEMFVVNRVQHVVATLRTLVERA